MKFDILTKRITFRMNYEQDLFPGRLDGCSVKFLGAVYYSLKSMVNAFAIVARRVNEANCRDIYSFLTKLLQCDTAQDYQKIQQFWNKKPNKTRLDKTLLQLTLFCYFPEQYKSELKKEGKELTTKEFTQLQQDFKQLTPYRIKRFLESLEEEFPNEFSKNNSTVSQQSSTL